MRYVVAMRTRAHCTRVYHEQWLTALCHLTAWPDSIQYTNHHSVRWSVDVARIFSIQAQCDWDTTKNVWPLTKRSWVKNLYSSMNDDTTCTSWKFTGAHLSFKLFHSWEIIHALIQALQSSNGAILWETLQVFIIDLCMYKWKCLTWRQQLPQPPL